MPPVPSSWPEAARSLGYGAQLIEEDDVAAVLEVLQGDWLTQGPAVERFELGLREATGAAHAVCVANGTSALQLANQALGVGPGCTVVTTANTFHASATASVLCGAEVDFVDVERATGNLDLDALEAWIEHNGAPYAVTAVHFAGLPLDMERLVALKRRHGFRIIEDAAHALGARYVVGGRSWRVGEHPDVDATCLSFHPVKTITCGEGGAVLTNDPVTARDAAVLRSQGVDRELGLTPFETNEPASWYGPMVALGANHRLSDLHAALGASQLAKLDRFLAHRRTIAQAYADELRGMPGVRLPDPGDDEHEHAWHLFVVHVDPARRDAIRAHLQGRGIGTQIHYYPVPRMPWFWERSTPRFLPHADAHARGCLSLPLHLGVDVHAVERVAEALAEATSAGSTSSARRSA